MHDLAASYSTYKLFTRIDIDEALATAKENGLLDECDWKIDDNGELRTFYAANDFGKDMIARYIVQTQKLPQPHRWLRQFFVGR